MHIYAGWLSQYTPDEDPSSSEIVVEEEGAGEVGVSGRVNSLRSAVSVIIIKELFNTLVLITTRQHTG